jgi:glucan phosphoethanolaminetransferase (alkaline phosphatase superfamily)
MIRRLLDAMSGPSAGPVVSTSRSELVRYLLAAVLMYLPILQLYPFDSNGRRPLIFGAYVAITVCGALLLRIPRAAAAPLLALSIPCSLYIALTGNEISYQVLASVYDTNLGEALEFLQAPLVWAFLGSTVLSFTLLARSVLRGPAPGSSRAVVAIPRRWLVGVIGASVAGMAALLPVGGHPRHFYPISFLRMNYDYYHETSSVLKRYQETARAYLSSHTASQESDANETHLLVIGEAARRHSMSVYGYGRETNPGLSRLAETDRGTLIFSDAIAAAPMTRVAVPSLLSVVDARDLASLADQPALIDVFNAAGFRTYFVTNQEPAGFYDDLAHGLLRRADRFVYMNEESTENRFDADLLPVVDEFLRDAAPRKLIVVHLAGSHYHYQERYPASEVVFPGEDLVDRYDNSIRYTDSVLTALIERLAEREEAVSLTYVSDHGENLNDCSDLNYGHGIRAVTRFELEIPFVVWGNQSLRTLRADAFQTLAGRVSAPVSHDNVSHTLLGLADVRTSAYVPQRDLSSPGFEATERYVVDSSKRIRAWGDLDLDSCVVEAYAGS